MSFTEILRIKTNWKKIQSENSTEKKKPFRRLKIKWKLKLFDETKKKKILKFKELCFPELSQISSGKLHKHLQSFIFFCPFLYYFFCIRFLLNQNPN